MLLTARAHLALVGAVLLALSACGGRARELERPEDSESQGGGSGTGTGETGAGETGTGGAGVNAAGGTPDQGGAAGTGTAGDSGSGGTVSVCAPLAPRLIRLSFRQLVASIEAVAGRTLADELRLEFDLAVDRARTFPALDRLNLIDDPVFQQTDVMAQRTATHVSENIEAFAGCAATGEIACVREFLPRFAEQAFRRPLTDVDVLDLARVADDAEALAGTAADVLWAGVYSVIQSPSFLYRTEFGETAEAAGELALAPHEVADGLAFFLSDGPPDAELLQAANDDRLRTEADVTREVERLLATPAVRINLERAVGDYLWADAIESAVLLDPAFTPAVRDSAATELDWFVSDHLFSEPLSSLLTSRRARIDVELAPLYGISFPPSGVTPDEWGFAQVTLPEARGGFLTRVGFLLAIGVPDGTDALYRGFRINQVVTRGAIPPYPDPITELTEAMLAASEALSNSSKRDKSEYRLTHPDCVECHRVFEPYGVALEGFDGVGRVRSTDEVGAPIRSSVTLPLEAGGVSVDGANEMAVAIVESGAFTTSIVKAFLEYALSEVRPEFDPACEAERVAHAGNDAFSRLVTEIAISAFRTRQGSAAARRFP